MNYTQTVMPDIENIEEENYSQGSADKSQITTSKEEVNENLSQEQAIESPELQTANLPAGQAGSKLQTEEMEIHHHPKVEKKNFKEYLLEFLMIFLAVTLGFFAENIREKITDKERAKIYAATMVNDLRADTAALKSYISYWSYAANNVDTLFQLLSEHQPKEIPSGKLYWYGLWAGAPTVFIPNDATFQQMKSAGTLRYFSNDLMQKVAQYDQLIRRMKIYDDQDGRIWTEVRKIRSEIFYVQFNEAANDIYQSSRVSPDQKRIDSFIRTNPPLLSNDKAVFNQYLELVRSRFMHSKVRAADTLLLHSMRLIDDLKKEYNLNE